MPHVVVQGARPLGELVREFLPLKARVEDTILRVELAYVEREGRSALFPALTVKGPLRQSFIVLVSSREGSVTVRLHEMTDPERTRPVQLALALVARWILVSSPDASLGPTNIGDAVEAVTSAS